MQVGQLASAAAMAPLGSQHHQVQGVRPLDLQPTRAAVASLVRRIQRFCHDAFVPGGERGLVELARFGNLDYLVFECLAERTIALAQQSKRSGASDGYDPLLVERLNAEGLIDQGEAERIPGGILAGVFPPVLDDGTACPHLPQPYISAPGSVFGGHHSEPGGLPIHVAFNLSSALSLADNYRRVYGFSGTDGLPRVVASGVPSPTPSSSDVMIDQDIVIAAHLDHQVPGANDNASGSGTLLELVRAANHLISAGKIPKPRRTIRFWWTTEIASDFWSYSALGAYTRPFDGGTVFSGTWQASGSASGSSSAVTTSTLNPDDTWKKVTIEAPDQ